MSNFREACSRVAGLFRRDPLDQRFDEEGRFHVEMLAADSVTIRVMVKTAPLEQWAVARALRQRIKARFDHEGIEIPFAQRVVWHREDRRGHEGSDDQNGVCTDVEHTLWTPGWLGCDGSPRAGGGDGW